jgi:hypothetical protein
MDSMLFVIILFLSYYYYIEERSIVAEKVNCEKISSSGTVKENMTLDKV